MSGSTVTNTTTSVVYSSTGAGSTTNDFAQTGAISAGAFNLSGFYVYNTYIWYGNAYDQGVAGSGLVDFIDNAMADGSVGGTTVDTLGQVLQFMGEGAGAPDAAAQVGAGANRFWNWTSTTDGDATTIYTSGGPQQANLDPANPTSTTSPPTGAGDSSGPGATGGINDASLTAASGQIVTVGASSDHWSLQVQLHNPATLGGTYGTNSTFGEELLLRDQQLVDFNGNGTIAVNADGTVASDYVTSTITGTGLSALTGNGSVYDSAVVTFTGASSTSLQALFRNLSVNLYSTAEHIAVQFTLTDTGTTGTSNTGSQTFVQFFQTACYVAGTRIATPDGERDIATLRIGDRVMTATGTPRAIKWIGRTHHTAAVIAANPHLRPVLIRQDAVALGMPHRDLMVSPQHAIYIDDAFVPAAALVNGVTVLRDDELAAVSYVHIELDAHDVVFAEGLPAETYVDDASRQMFDNADEFYDLYGADAGVTAFSAPRLEEGVQLETIRRRLAGLTVTAGTGALIGNVERIEDGVLVGWLADQTSTTAVVFDVLADGEVVGQAIANRYRVDLDFHGINGGRAGFTMALPAAVTGLGQISLGRAGDGVRVAAVAEAVTV